MSRIACLLIMLAACGGKPAPAVSSKAPATPPAEAPVVTLKDLQNGDRACYVVVMAGTEEKHIEGDFDLCEGGKHDATALIGKQVTYTTKKARVLAMSCEGDVGCGKSDEVDLVISITAAP